MTALVGLKTRLRMARLALVVPPDHAEPEAADFAAHGADLLLFTRGERSVEEAAHVIDVARRRLFGLQTIVATDSNDVGEACQADVVYWRRPRAAAPGSSTSCGRRSGPRDPSGTGP